MKPAGGNALSIMKEYRDMNASDMLEFLKLIAVHRLLNLSYGEIDSVRGLLVFQFFSF